MINIFIINKNLNHNILFHFLRCLKSDMLWADPVDQDEGMCDGIYRYNEVRGCSYFFG